MLVFLLVLLVVLTVAFAQLSLRFRAKAAEEDDMRSAYEENYSGPPTGGSALHHYNECRTKLARYKRLKALFGLAAVSCLSGAILTAYTVFRHFMG